ncbi:MAG: AraC family transcriptional regulator [Planctomycetota bacterium]|nr:AraC family transcriptional regulator [Planctomycetota bacterium]
MRIPWQLYSAEPRLIGRYPWGQSGKVSWQGGLYDHLLWLVAEGAGTLTSPSGTHALQPGSLVWFKPGAATEVVRDGPVLTNYAVVFALRDSQGRDLPLGSPLPDDVLHEPQAGFTLAILQRLQALGAGTGEGARSAFTGTGRHCARHLLTGLLMELDRHNEDTSSAPPPHLSATQAAVFRLARRIAENPATAPSVAEQARLVGITPTHLCRVYRVLLKRSPAAFARLFRLRHAQRLLVETNASCADIAAQLGYGTQAFFSRQFKQAQGLSPSAFRRHMQQQGESEPKLP